MGRLDDVLTTLAQAVGTAILNAGVVGSAQSNVVDTKTIDFTIGKGQVIIGWPIATELTEIMATDGNWQVSIFPHDKAKPTTRFRPRRRYSAGQSTVLAAVVNGVITLSGAVSRAGDNVHVVLDRRHDIRVATSFPQTLAQLATAVASAVNAASLPGISAAPSGNTTAISGAFDVICNVATVGTASREVGRFERDLQVSIWASDPITRDVIQGAVLPQIGSVTAAKLTLPDSTRLWVRYGGDLWNDNSQSSYSMYIAHHLARVEYGIMQTEPAYQIGVTEFVSVVNNHAPVTAAYGEAL